MQTRLTLFTLVLTFCLLPFAQAADRDVPDVAKWEALRRGNYVQEIGGPITASETLLAEAVAPPEDDSHKWYITLVTTEGCSACERLKRDLARAPELRAWVNVDDSEKSPTHYHLRRYEDRTQRDWLRGIDAQLKRGGFPAIVIQPPRSGQFGKCATTVGILHGYAGDPAAMAERIRRAVTTYVREYSAQRHRFLGPAPGGIRQVADKYDHDGVDIAGPPPFVVPAPNQQPPPNDWPAVINPRPLSADQIKQLVPQAPPDFVLTVLQSQAAEPGQVLQQWQLYQLQQQATPEQSSGSSFSLLAWFNAVTGGGTLAGLVSLAILVWRKLSGDKEVQEGVRKLFDHLTKTDG